MEEAFKEKYTKDFDTWGQNKKALNERILDDAFFFLEREIWWASLGVNIGKEMDGKNNNFERPILILTKFSHDTFLAVPLSSQLKDGESFHTILNGGKNKTVWLEQTRFLSSKRLLRLISRMDETEFNIIKEKVLETIQGNSGNEKTF